MSWDVVIFKQNRKIANQAGIDERALVDIGDTSELKLILTQFFKNVRWENDWGLVEKDDYSIEFAVGPPGRRVSSTMFFLNGTNAIYPVIDLCRQNKWQAFDTRSGSIIDLDNPEKGGYTRFNEYLAYQADNK